ncbi:hypothetical protein BpHYR1_008274 [Brachionus plicatilis]|uniref:Uncharacterized protein n=1 Tax=Brachionus plicatilis TaxID=10195 RepID=A0A3M7ST01_BRAPC|nr:hypothetical protein BpHYR1_008274 [Brachionus plicatilis]
MIICALIVNYFADKKCQSLSSEGPKHILIPNLLFSEFCRISFLMKFLFQFMVKITERAISKQLALSKNNDKIKETNKTRSVSKTACIITNILKKLNLSNNVF